MNALYCHKHIIISQNAKLVIHTNSINSKLKSERINNIWIDKLISCVALSRSNMMAHHSVLLNTSQNSINHSHHRGRVKPSGSLQLCPPEKNNRHIIISSSYQIQKLDPLFSFNLSSKYLKKNKKRCFYLFPIFDIFISKPLFTVLVFLMTRVYHSVTFHFMWAVVAPGGWMVHSSSPHV